MMQPAIGPFSKPASFNNVLRQVFAVTQNETPRDIATLLARLAAAESTTASRESLSGGLDDGALMRRLRRLRYF